MQSRKTFLRERTLEGASGPARIGRTRATRAGWFHILLIGAFWSRSGAEVPAPNWPQFRGANSVASLPGRVTVVKAGGTKPEVLHQSDFGTRILATPALVGENLYLRTATHLWAYGPGPR